MKASKNNTKTKKEFAKIKSLPYKDFMQQLISNLENPEFKSKLTQLLNSDNVDSDYGAITETYVKASFLIPTQSQIGLKESLKYLKDKKSIRDIVLKKEAKLFVNDKILVANKKWILDGHHRWTYVHLLNPKAEIPCININLPEQDPVNINKDLQLAIAATYGDIYTKETPIEYNISQMSDTQMMVAMRRLITKENLELLREVYGQTSLKKYILKEFIVPKSLYEQYTDKDFNTNDLNFNEEENMINSMEDDPSMSQIVNTDNNNPKFAELQKTQQQQEGQLASNDSDGIVSSAESLFSTAADVAGAFDPTGIVDITQCVYNLYKGDIGVAILYFLSVIPVADLVTKPLIQLLKNAAIRKGMQLLGKAMLKFDIESAAKIWLKLEKRFPVFGDFLMWIVKGIDTCKNFVARIMNWVGSHWLKFKIFSNIFFGRIKEFFQGLLDWKKRLKESLTKVSKSEVFGILSSNAVKIKRLIVDRKVDQMNVNFTLGPHPIQSALMAGYQPYMGSFQGVPEDLLKNIPSVMGALRISGESDDEKGLEDFQTFASTKSEDGKKSKTMKKDSNPLTDFNTFDKKTKEKKSDKAESTKISSTKSEKGVKKPA